VTERNPEVGTESNLIRSPSRCGQYKGLHTNKGTAHGKYKQLLPTKIGLRPVKKGNRFTKLSFVEIHKVK
jgi:hypothetical protein